MTLTDFLALDSIDKVSAIRYGHFMAFRDEQEYRLVLYKLENFFVEVYYHNKTNCIERLRPWKGSKRLQAYFTYRLN